MIGKVIDKILHEDERLVDENNESVKKDKEQELIIGDKKGVIEILFVVLIIIIAIGYRLYFLFFVSGVDNAGVGWYGDTYHHWQIGYLTYTSGLKHGFLRLWDLKGMEYFWGPLHPLILCLIFAITGVKDIIILRLLSVFFGVASIYLLYLLGRRYWGRTVGIAILFFGALFPVAVFNDVSGMLEPIGVFLLLLGIYLWPKHALVSGFSLALSSMARAEAWLFSFVIMLGILFQKKHLHEKTVAALCYFFVMIIYMKYLLDATGNPIYPVWWNYLANAMGAWANGQDQLTPAQLAMRPILIIIAIMALSALIWVIVKRPKNFLLHLYGWGNIFFLGAFMGIGHYLKGWEWWFPVIRFFVFPYLFISLILFSILFRKGKLKIVFFVLGWSLVIMLVLISQLTWLPIMQRFNPTKKEWETTVTWSKDVAQYYNGGKILFPEGDPHFTYGVYKYAGVKGEDIVGQMFDPYFYFDKGTAYTNWGNNRKVVLKWIKSNDIKLALFRKDTDRYQELIKREPQLFKLLKVLDGGVYQIWQVYPEKIKI